MEKPLCEDLQVAMVGSYGLKGPVCAEVMNLGTETSLTSHLFLKLTYLDYSSLDEWYYTTQSI